MSDNVAVEAPNVEFVRPCNLCPHMKRITLPKILDSLVYLKEEVVVDPAIAARARRAVERRWGILFQNGALFSTLTVAENVAYGCKETTCVIQQWVNSAGHRRNMLIPSLTRYGLASAISPSG